MAGLPSSANTGPRRILLATDFSRGARSALRRVIRLPLAADATLLPPPRAARTRMAQPAGCDGFLRRSARQALTGLEARVARAARRALPGVRVTTALVQGRPAPAIARRARTMKADLIVLGRHGQRGVSPAAHRLDGPAGRAGQPGAGADRPPPARRSLPAAARGARRFAGGAAGLSRDARDPGRAGTLRPRREGLRPAQGGDAASRGRVDGGDPPLRERMPGASPARHRALPRGALPHPPGVSPSRPREDRPGRSVLGEADRRRTDLVALGTRGRAGVRSAGIGGVAEAVIQHARTDVLVAPARSPSAARR